MHKGLSAIGLVFTLILLSAIGMTIGVCLRGYTEQRWTEFIPDDCSFTALFPQSPAHEVEPAPPPFEQSEAHLFTASTPRGSYQITWFNSNVPTNSATFASPNPVTVPSGPTLRIATVAGVAAPAQPFGSLAGVPDVVVPAATTNPVSVGIEAANIPLGAVVQVTVTPTNGSRTTAQSSPLAGSSAASTATASVNLASGVSVLSATAIVDVSQTALFIEGERVNRIEIAAVYGGQSEVTYITQSGRRIRKND